MATEADVAALFTSVLGRAPDAGGLEYFTDFVNQGGTLEQVGQALASSKEGQVRALYSDVFGRQADAGGQKFFADQAIAGTPIADIRKAMAYSPEAQDLIEKIYTTDLKRKSDIKGKQFFTDKIATGGLLSDVRKDIQASTEAQGLLGTTKVVDNTTKVVDNTTKTDTAANVANTTIAKDYTGDVNAAFQKVFGRDADPSGAKFWGGKLAGGMSAADFEAALRSSAEGVQAARGIRSVPFGSQIVDGRLQQMAQYAQPAVQAGQAMGAPSLQGFLAGRQGQVSGNDINSLYRNVLGRAPDPGGVDYYTAKMKGGATLGDVEAEMRGSAEFRQPLAQFQQSMQYQTALPGMVQPFNPADIPKTFQQVISPGPRLDMNQTVIPGWLQASINAQKAKDGIEVTDADKFAAANTKTTYSGLGGTVTNAGTTGANTGGLLAASQISPLIISGYGDYVGVAPGSIDLPGASYWQNLLNKGTPIADIYSGMAGTAAGLLYAPTRQAKLAAAASAAADAGRGGSDF
jgi:hypothetical protein